MRRLYRPGSPSLTFPTQTSFTHVFEQHVELLLQLVPASPHAVHLYAALIAHLEPRQQLPNVQFASIARQELTHLPDVLHFNPLQQSVSS